MFKNKPILATLHSLWIRTSNLGCISSLATISFSHSKVPFSHEESIHPMNACLWKSLNLTTKSQSKLFRKLTSKSQSPTPTSLTAWSSLSLSHGTQEKEKESSSRGIGSASNKTTTQIRGSRKDFRELITGNTLEMKMRWDGCWKQDELVEEAWRKV